MNLDHPIFFPMYSVAIRDSSLLVGGEYWWHILPKVSFYILIMRSVSSFLNLMKRVLGPVLTAVRYLDNSNCLLVFWLRIIAPNFSTIKDGLLKSRDCVIQVFFFIPWAASVQGFEFDLTFFMASRSLAVTGKFSISRHPPVLDRVSNHDGWRSK